MVYCILNKPRTKGIGKVRILTVALPAPNGARKHPQGTNPGLAWTLRPNSVSLQLPNWEFPLLTLFTK